jgi:hypothetical protein
MITRQDNHLLFLPRALSRVLPRTHSSLPWHILPRPWFLLPSRPPLPCLLLLSIVQLHPMTPIHPLLQLHHHYLLILFPFQLLLMIIPGHFLGPGRVGPGQRKARCKKSLPRPGPARLSGRNSLPRPGPWRLFFVGLSGRRAGPS